MELHKALKEIIVQRGVEMIKNTQIINFLLDYQAFKEKPATKLILRDVINAGYGEAILALKNTNGWQTKFKQYEHEFIDSCGYKEELAAYVFEAIAYALGMNDGENEEPAIKPSFSVDSFFDIPEVEAQQLANTQQNAPLHGPDPTDLYTIALSFYNEGKYQQAKGFIEKALSAQPNSAIPSSYMKLLGDILMRIGEYEGAVKCYNECFTLKAKEEQCTIDQLRESFKQHKVNGFESIMFCYFFCLYSLKMMNEAQWLQFVKGEARFGLTEAIRYCADYAINPVEDHFNIYFSDKNKVLTGDYLFEDGTFAHEYSTTKTVVARIIISETSKNEKLNGWNYGYIIPIEKSGRALCTMDCMWSTIKEDLSFPHSHYTIDDLNHWDKISKIESEHLITISDFNKFPVFNAVKKFPIKIPVIGASEWFLPSIHWFKRCMRSFKEIDTFIPYSSYWTSSQSDREMAVYLYFNYLRNGQIYDVIYRCGDKMKEHKFLPIAAF